MPAYRDKRDGRWRYRFRVDGKRYNGTAPAANNTKKKAEELERRRLEKIAKRPTFAGEMPTVAKFADKFLDHQRAHVKPLTIELQTSIVRDHIVPHIGRVRLEDVGTAELDMLKRVWKAGGEGGDPPPAADTTINTRLGVAKRMLSVALDWKIIESAPKSKNLKIPDLTPRWLNDEESARLLDAAREYDDKGVPDYARGSETRRRKRRRTALRWYVMILVGLRTGLRIGELRGLQWLDIDLARSQLHVCRSDPGRSSMEAGTPKSGKERVVPLTEDACIELEAWKATMPSARPDDWVFPGASTWKHLRDRKHTRGEGTCNDAMGYISNLAGFGDGEVTWHTLRHSFASQLAVRGVSLREIQDMLGHASITQTEVYAHLIPNKVHHDAVRLLGFAMVAPMRPSRSLPASAPVRHDSDTFGQQVTNNRLSPPEITNDDD